MKTLDTTCLSSKGQVVIPENIRKSLKLHTGDNFVAMGHQDVIVLKLISRPSLKEFDDLIAIARKQASKAKLKKVHIKMAIKESRQSK